MMKLFFAVLAFLVLYTVAQETLSTESLWKKYRSELFNFLRAGDDDALPGLQLVTTPFPAEWDTNPEILQEIVTRIPNWGASWSMTNKDFRDAYEDFLTNLNIPPQPKGNYAALDRIEDELFELEVREGREMMNCLSRYQNYQEQFKLYQTIYKEIQPKPFENYKQMFCRSLFTAEQNLVNKRGELYRAQYDLRDQYYDARHALGKFASTPESQRTFNAYGNLARFAAGAEAGNVNGFEVKITSKTSESVRNTVTQSMGIGFNGQFFGVPVSASLNMGKEEMKFKTSTKDFQLIFGAKGYMVIPVFPSKTWYDPAVVAKYAKGPFRKTKRYFFDVATKSFHKDAVMPMVVRNLFVVVGPKIDMYVSKDDAEQIEKKKNFGLSFNVAGLEFNFQKGAQMEKQTAFNALSRITITGDSNTPQLLAVESQILPQM